MMNNNYGEQITEYSYDQPGSLLHKGVLPLNKLERIRTTRRQKQGPINLVRPGPVALCVQRELIDSLQLWVSPRME